jgi:hypothetical protein
LWWLLWVGAAVMVTRRRLSWMIPLRSMTYDSDDSELILDMGIDTRKFECQLFDQISTPGLPIIHYRPKCKYRKREYIPSRQLSSPFISISMRYRHVNANPFSFPGNFSSTITQHVAYFAVGTSLFCTNKNYG